MQNLLKELWYGEQGAVISTELALVIAVMLVAAQSGVGVGLEKLSSSVNGKLTEVGEAIDHIPVGYAYAGKASCTAWVKGVCFDGSDRRYACPPALLVDDPCLSASAASPRTISGESNPVIEQEIRPDAVGR